MKLVDAVANAVAAEGVSVAFNLPDEITIHVIQSLHECGIRVIRGRHEQNVLAMADGYARASGDIGVCSIGPGPAFAQTGNGLVTAQRRGSPVLVLLGSTQRGLAKDFDARNFVENLGARYFELTSPLTAADDIARAFKAIRQTAGPVVLAVPHEQAIVDLEVHGWNYSPTKRAPFRAAEVDPESELIQDAAGILASARRPVILAGRGAVQAGAKQELEALAERLGAPLGTSLQGNGFFRGHPLNMGMIGGFATAFCTQAIAEADVVLAVGISLNYYQLGGDLPSARVIQVDTELSRIGLLTRVDLPIVADAKEAVRALNRALEAADIAGAQPWAGSPGANGVQHTAGTDGVETGQQKVSVTEVLPALERMLPSDRVLVVDGGGYLPFVMDMVSVPDPGSWIWTLDFASIGLGLPIALGVKAARPQRPVYVIAGDGGFMMNIQELETAVREHLPVTVVVFNNSSYAPEADRLKARGKPIDLGNYDDVDFAAVARAFGAEAATVRNVDDLAACAALLSSCSSPVILDVKTAEYPNHSAYASR
jgi:acetolactate synthase I/II/III large subunit